MDQSWVYAHLIGLQNQPRFRKMDGHGGKPRRMSEDFKWPKAGTLLLLVAQWLTFTLLGITLPETNQIAPENKADPAPKGSKRIVSRAKLLVSGRVTFKLWGITYLAGKIKCKLFFHRPLAERVLACWIFALFFKVKVKSRKKHSKITIQF